MNALNLRLKTKKDIVPTQSVDQSWMEWFEQNGGKLVCVNGFIGYSGTKIHRLVAEYMNINGENVIISLSSHCGSQHYKSGLSVNFNYSEDQITCKKCKCK